MDHARLESGAAGGGLARALASLRHRNFRLWTLGQGVSNVGTWMQLTAQGFLVFELTGSAEWLGWVGFAAGLPVWLLMLPAGVVTDRVSRRGLLLATQAAYLLTSAALAALTFTGTVAAWHVVALSFVTGIATAFDAPARQSFVLDMVPREDMANAIAINGGMFNLAVAVGPALSGLAHAALGPAWCFTLNALSFVAVIAALLVMDLPRIGGPPDRRSLREELSEGLGFIARHEVVRAVILLVSVTSLFGLAFATITPAWAVRVLDGDATTNGLLVSLRGVGATACAAWLAATAGRRSKGPLMLLGAFLYPMALLAAAWATSVPAALAAYAVLGAGLILTYNSANALVQSLVPDALRGRVMGAYTLTFFGFQPLCALLAGAAADRVGERLTLAASAGLALAAALAALALVPRLRR